jgi:hypothetical protein
MQSIKLEMFLNMLFRRIHIDNFTQKIISVIEISFKINNIAGTLTNPVQRSPS